MALKCVNNAEPGGSRPQPKHTRTVSQPKRIHTVASAASNSAAAVTIEPNVTLAEQNVEVDFHSDTAGKSIDRLAKLMASFFEKSFRAPVGQYFSSFTPKGDALPEFNPRNKNQEAELWCNKTAFKIKGSAEVWYKGLRSVKYSWAERKVKLCAAFPSSRDYYTSLVEMIEHKKKRDEDLVTYCYEKIALLNPLKIEGANAVSCIICGLNNEIVAVGAKAGNHQTPESLLAYLNTLLKAGPSGICKPSMQSAKKHNCSCFKCDKAGHIAKNCRVKITTHLKPKPEIKSETKGESKPEKSVPFVVELGIWRQIVLRRSKKISPKSHD